MNILGIIPARKGSQRLPGKNLKLLKEEPLIVHTFKAAKSSASLSRLIVSTNDEEVIRLAQQHGIEVPFLRPEEYASDTATDFDWVSHAVGELKKQGWLADYVVILRPTQPLRQPEDIDLAVTQIKKLNGDSVRSLTKVKHHPFWMKRLDGRFAVPFLDLGTPEEKLRSQDLPTLYRLNGMVDVISVKNLEGDSLYGQSMGYIVIEEDRAVDIDTEKDFHEAEFRMQKQNQPPAGGHGLSKELDRCIKPVNSLGRQKIILIGARIDAHAGVVLDVIRQFELYEVAGFIDENTALHGRKIQGIPVLGGFEAVDRLPPEVSGYFVCAGDNRFRERAYQLMKNGRLQFVRVIHPSAVISPEVKIDEGVYIGANATITHHCSLGKGVIINTGASIDHDNFLEDFVNVSPGAHTSGRVQIKKGAFLGTGAITIPDIIIGEDALVGAGAVVIRDVESGSRVAGVPARNIGTKEKKTEKEMGEEEVKEEEAGEKEERWLKWEQTKWEKTLR